nr:xylulose kinase-1 [Tanacetum cinerariifolium]
MEYWITNNDMNIWKLIQNGNSLKKTRRDRDGGVIILPSMTAEEHIVVQKESKARTTLLQSILDDHVADFHYMDDARDIWNAVKARGIAQRILGCSVKSSEHKPTDSTSCASTSSVSTSVNEAEIESNVGTPIKEPIIVQDLPSFTCHFRKNASSVSKLCFVCGSGTHLIKDCDFYKKQMANKTVGIGVGPVCNRNKVNYQNQVVPQVILLKTGKVVLGNHIEKVYTGYPRTIVDLIHLHTDDNVADLLTKAFDGPRHADAAFYKDVMLICADFSNILVKTQSSRYVVPTGSVIVATGRFVVLA